MKLHEDSVNVANTLTSCPVSSTETRILCSMRKSELNRGSECSVRSNFT